MIDDDDDDDDDDDETRNDTYVEWSVIRAQHSHTHTHAHVRRLRTRIALVIVRINTIICEFASLLRRRRRCVAKNT